MFNLLCNYFRCRRQQHHVLLQDENEEIDTELDISSKYNKEKEETELSQIITHSTPTDSEEKTEQEQVETMEYRLTLWETVKAFSKLVFVRKNMCGICSSGFLTLVGGGLNIALPYLFKDLLAAL